MRRAAPALAGVALACATGSSFSPHLPPDLPDVSKWEKSSGSAEFGAPRSRLEYELYVAPSRPSVYSVTRYRVSLKAAVDPVHEKLQWDRDGRDVRRYECVPETNARSYPCQWRELERGSADYNRELPTLLSVYSMHAALLRGRE